MASLDEILNDEELIKWLHNREMEHQEIECLFRQLAMLANIFYKEDIKYYEN